MSNSTISLKFAYLIIGYSRTISNRIMQDFHRRIDYYDSWKTDMTGVEWIR